MVREEEFNPDFINRALLRIWKVTIFDEWQNWIKIMNRGGKSQEPGTQRVGWTRVAKHKSPWISRGQCEITAEHTGDIPSAAQRASEWQRVGTGAGHHPALRGQRTRRGKRGLQAIFSNNMARPMARNPTQWDLDSLQELQRLIPST